MKNQKFQPKFRSPLYSTRYQIIGEKTEPKRGALICDACGKDGMWALFESGLCARCHEKKLQGKPYLKLNPTTEGARDE